MSISVFDMFKIGIGPSSSHTVGPMKASKIFLKLLKDRNIFDEASCINIELLGSLGATGIGHGTNIAVVLGLLGEEPHLVDVDSISSVIENIKENKTLKLLNEKQIVFDIEKDIKMLGREFLSYHPNAIRYRVYNSSKQGIFSKIYYSIGGGLIICEDDIKEDKKARDVEQPFHFKSANELLSHCKKNSKNISEIMMENEKVFKDEQLIKDELLKIWQVMKECVKRGCSKGGVLPGRIKIKRRANDLYEKLSKNNTLIDDPLNILDWVNLFALAVNEENACGGRVVTAPTNGAAGIIPAVMHYMCKFVFNKNKKLREENVINFLLTAGAIGILYQKNASISGADVGCQGEVGVACSMASGALAECLGGNVEQVENAAEIGMEHNLGLTCDPVAGLVQVPCIERNAMGAVKAINATRMALNGEGEHFVSLDDVIKTMFITGKDMMNKYKETSQGGLAVNITQC